MCNKVTMYPTWNRWFAISGPYYSIPVSRLMIVWSSQHKDLELYHALHEGTNFAKIYHDHKYWTILHYHIEQISISGLTLTHVAELFIILCREGVPGRVSFNNLFAIVGVKPVRLTVAGS